MIKTLSKKLEIKSEDEVEKVNALELSEPVKISSIESSEVDKKLLGVLEHRSENKDVEDHAENWSKSEKNSIKELSEMHKTSLMSRQKCIKNSLNESSKVKVKKSVN